MSCSHRCGTRSNRSCQHYRRRKDHPLSKGPITIEKLAEARWAVLRHNALIRNQMEAVPGSMGFQLISVGFECRTEGMVLDLIEMSDMLTMLPGRSRAV